jgi:hypothetical protein
MRRNVFSTLKFDILHNFISPVTGRVLADPNYVLVGNKNGIAIPSPILIDIRLDLINLRKRYNTLVTTDFVIGHENKEIPNAQVLSKLEDGFLYNTDGIVSTLPTSPKLPLCYAATTGNLVATYNNGTAGVGATLTIIALGAFTIDGQTPPVNSVILVKDQLLSYQNGIYDLTTVGGIATAPVLTRNTSYNQPDEIQAGDIVAVEHGTVNSNTLWVQTQVVNVIGTDSILFIPINLFNTLPDKNIWIGNSSNRPEPHPRIELNNLPTFLTINPANNFGIYNLYTGQLLGITDPTEVSQPTRTLRIDKSNTPNLSVGKMWIGTRNFVPPVITIDGTPPYVHISGSLNWDALGAVQDSHGVIDEVGLAPKEIFIGNTDPTKVGQISKTIVIYIDNLPNLTLKRIWRGNVSGRPVESDDLTTLELQVTNIEDVLIPGLEAEIAALEAEIVALQAEIVEIQTQLVALAAAIAVVQGQVTILTARLDNLKLNDIPADGDVSLYNFKITNLANPVNATDAVNLQTLSLFPGTVTSVSGTAGQISVANGTTTPVISIDPTYVGQSSITTVGTLTNLTVAGVTSLNSLITNSLQVISVIVSSDLTVPVLTVTSTASFNTITAGVWNGSAIPLAYGGTNANLTASNGGIFYSTATAGAILSGTATANQILLSGSSAAPSWSTATYPSTVAANRLLYASAANTITGLATANSSVLMTDGSGVPAWQTTTSNLVSSITGTTNQITASSSTGNVTLSIATGYVGQTSITTLGTITSGTWNGSIIPLAYGGTNANLTASNGGIFYSTATAGAILAGTATANRVLLSGSSAAPAWSTATYPATTTANQLLYSSATNTVGGITTANNSVLLTNGSGVPAWQTLTSSAVTSLTGTANQITVSASTGAVTLSMPSAVVITTSVAAGNMQLTGNSIITTNTNGDMTISPNGTGRVGMGSSPSYFLDVFGTTRITKLLGRSSSAPTAALGAATGSGPGQILIGSETAGAILITTGGSGSGTGLIATFTISAMPSSTYGVIFFASNANAAPLNIWAASTSTTTFTLNTTTALTNSTTYIWNYMVIGQG